MPAATATVAADQATEYQAEVPKTIIELQQFRDTASLAIVGPKGSPGQATLVQLNPNVNAWLLLVLDWGSNGGRLSYHLENPQPSDQHTRLADARSVVITRGNSSVACDVWTAGKDSPLEQARHSSLPYVPLCGGRLFLRNPTRGNYTQLEMVTNFLRHYVWGGEKIIGFVREHFYHDAFLEREVWALKSPPANLPRRLPRWQQLSDRVMPKVQSSPNISESISAIQRTALFPGAGIPLPEWLAYT